MDIRVVDSLGNDVVTTDSKPIGEHGSLENNPLPEVLNKAVADVMGLDGDREKVQFRDKINTLLEYAKSETDDHSPENIKWIIRSLELKLGSPPFSEKRINYVARYAYLKMEEKGLQKEINNMIRAGI